MRYSSPIRYREIFWGNKTCINCVNNGTSTPMSQLTRWPCNVDCSRLSCNPSATSVVPPASQSASPSTFATAFSTAGSIFGTTCFPDTASLSPRLWNLSRKSRASLLLTIYTATPSTIPISAGAWVFCSNKWISSPSSVCVPPKRILDTPKSCEKNIFIATWARHSDVIVCVAPSNHHSLSS